MAFIVMPVMTCLAANDTNVPVNNVVSSGSDPYGFGKKLNDVAGSYATQSCSSDNCLVERVGSIIQIALSLLGIVFLILMLIAGFNWMTAAGEEERITKSKDTIRAAIIGLLIVVGAYAASVFVLEQVWGITSGSTATINGSGASQAQ